MSLITRRSSDKRSQSHTELWHPHCELFTCSLYFYSPFALFNEGVFHNRSASDSAANTLHLQPLSRPSIMGDPAPRIYSHNQSDPRTDNWEPFSNLKGPRLRLHRNEEAVGVQVPQKEKGSVRPGDSVIRSSLHVVEVLYLKQNFTSN